LAGVVWRWGNTIPKRNVMTNWLILCDLASVFDALPENVRGAGLLAVPVQALKVGASSATSGTQEN
jgi:hypothetical protein